MFQPHTYTPGPRRSWTSCTEALSAADEVILADIYAARETDTLGSVLWILRTGLRAGVKAHYIPSFDDIETFILENCVNGDVLITMGAGDIVKVGEKLLGRLVIHIIHRVVNILCKETMWIF